MIRIPRLSRAGWFVAASAAVIGSAAIFDVTAETFAGIFLLSLCGALTLSLIGAACRGPEERPRLLGFAASGWGGFALVHWYSYYLAPLPTVGFMLDAGAVRRGAVNALPPGVRLGHYGLVLVLAVIGGALAGFLSDRDRGLDDERPSAGDAAGWWRKPALMGLLGSGLVVAAAMAGWWWDLAIGAGAAFLLTWCLLGLALLGAFLGVGRRRAAWIGASSFGLGYLILTFGPFLERDLPTHHFLNAVFRPDYPTRAGDRPDDGLTDGAENLRIERALEQPVSLRLSEKTSLQDVVDQIKKAIRGSLSKDLIVYANAEGESRDVPMDLIPLEVDKEVSSLIRNEIPAKDALRLCLGPLRLTYRVQPGYVRIFPDVYRPIPLEDDPVMIVGHSMLALIAAAFGGVAAPIVAGLCGRQVENGGRPVT